MSAAARALPSSTTTSTAPDSWRRTVPDDAKFTQERQSWLIKFFGKVATRRALTDEEKILVALAWCGAAAPLEELAVRSGVSSPSAKPDSARKQARRMITRLIEREVLAPTVHIRQPFAACTHIDHAKFPGEKGRLECQRLRKQRGRRETCSAHHGYEIRALVADLTVPQLCARLSIDGAEITRRLAAKRAVAEAERREAGRQANDAEGRKLRGLPVKRGPRGSNHTSPRYAKRALPASSAPTDVPPNPREGERDLEITASFDREGGDREDRPGSSAQPALSEGFAPAARVDGSWFGEPPPPGPAMGSGRADEGGGSRTMPEPTPRATGTPAPGVESESSRGSRPTGLSSPLDLAGGGAGLAKIIDMAKKRETRAIVDWFKAEWATRRLPPLADEEARKFLWSRAMVFSRADLGVALRVATKRAPKDGPATFRRLFTSPNVLAEIIDETKVLEERKGAAPRAAVPVALTFVTKGAPAAAEAKPTMGASMPAPAAWMSPSVRADAEQRQFLAKAAENAAKFAAAANAPDIYALAATPPPSAEERRREKLATIARLQAEVWAEEGASGAKIQARARAARRARKKHGTKRTEDS